jgi:hypothetical protein
MINETSKVIAEDPTAYEFDSLFDDMKKEERERILSKMPKEKKARFMG